MEKKLIFFEFMLPFLEKTLIFAAKKLSRNFRREIFAVKLSKALI